MSDHEIAFWSLIVALVSVLITLTAVWVVVKARSESK
jgi:hypothetical protein